MEKLLRSVKGKSKKVRGNPAGGVTWMRTQLVRMAKMNQGVISMSGTK